MPIGFQIKERERAVDAQTAERFKMLPVANVSDCMARMSAGGSRLRPYHAHGVRFAGPALTVKTRPGDNLVVHKALDLASEGDVLVIDAGGDLTNSLMGEIMVAIALRKRVAAIVIDGAIRDAEEIRSSGIAMFAAGVTHRGPYKDGPGEVNVPVAIDGMVVEPGDLMLGDGDGILCVPYADAADLLRAAEAKQAAEKEELTAIEQGTNDRSWVDRTLHERGCSGVDG